SPRQPVGQTPGFATTDYQLWTTDCGPLAMVLRPLGVAVGGVVVRQRLVGRLVLRVEFQHAAQPAETFLILPVPQTDLSRFQARPGISRRLDHRLDDLFQADRVGLDLFVALQATPGLLGLAELFEARPELEVNLAI